MAMSPTSFVWYELMTTDMDAAQTFYGNVVGWEAQPWDGGAMRYTIMNADGKPAAGVMALPEEARQAGAPPAWIGYIQADDVDAATGRIRQAGGAVHRQPDDIPGVGRFSVVADPQGAVFMLFKPVGQYAPPPPMTRGHVGWRELYADEWEGAFAFYAGQFGWTKAQAVDMGPMGTYQTFSAGGDPIGGMMNKPAQAPAAGWLFYFNVEAADAATARVKENGGRVLMGPMQVPGGSWVAQCMDPQGAMFALVAPAR